MNGSTLVQNLPLLEVSARREALRAHARAAIEAVAAARQHHARVAAQAWTPAVQAAAEIAALDVRLANERLRVLRGLLHEVSS